MSQTKSESSACRCFFIWTHWKDAMHYYPHHIGDFTRDTARLSDAQCMAYLRMIWAYYDTEKPLPDNPESLAFQLGTSADLVRQILSHYFVLDDGAWRHARCDAVILEYKSKSGKARESANARWKNASAMRTHTVRNANEPKNDANQEPLTINHKPTEEEDGENAAAVLPCPQQSVIDLYHEHLPSGRQVREWTPARQALLRTRWREKANRQNLDWWARLFAYCQKSDFLTGRSHGPGRKPFEVSLDWLLKAENMAKVIEGAYENQGATA